MTKKKLNIRVFKLRSGEELVAEVIGRVRGKITINRPMKIVTNISTDPISGTKRNMMYLCDWLGSSTQIKVNLPTDFIVVDLPPDPDVTLLYKKQMSMDDNGKDFSDPFFPVTDKDIKKMADDVYKNIEKMLKECDGHLPTKEEKLDQFPFGEFGKIPFPPNERKTPPMVQFAISIPNEIMVDWIERGFIEYLKDCISDFMNVDFIDELMEAEEKIKKSKKRKMPKKSKIQKEEWSEPPESEKKSDQFGNNIKDWSPYLKDYLDEPPTPPKQN